MANYKNMYFLLFNKISDAVILLQAAQAEAEERYMSPDDPNIVFLDNPFDEE